MSTLSYRPLQLNIAAAILAMSCGVGSSVAYAYDQPHGLPNTSANVKNGIQLDIATSLDPARVTTDNDAASIVSADRIEGSPDTELHLFGNAEVRRAGTVLKADEITYVQQTDEVTAKGNAKISHGGVSFSGPSINFRLSTRSGSMEDAEWEYAPRNIHGCARNAVFLSGDHTSFEDVKFTTCKREDQAWFIKMDKLTLDETDETATGRNATLNFYGVPVFGSPWFSFPISNKRHSGFLTPTYGLSSTRGIDVSIPYYFNIAPNYDLTLTPRIMSKRGVMLSTEARVLLDNFYGQANIDFLPDDQQTKTNRYATHLQARYQKDKFSFDIDYNKVSDDNYINDFSGNIRESSEAVLPQNYTANWTDTYWNAQLRVQKNQTLKIDGIQQITPYERVPQFTWNGYVGDYHGFEISTKLDATRFQHPSRIGGSRFVIDQSVSYPLQGAGWFVIPKGEIVGAWYDLTHLDRDTNPDAYVDRHPSRISPIFTLDSGLIFERNSSWFGRSALQTLEPRIFYAYSPYRDQSDIPIFDTTITDLSFATLFTENYFSGYDRISQANQLTTALTTRYIDQASGLELFRASIGQRQYFENQNVQFLNNTSEYNYYLNSSSTNGLRTDVSSDLLASVAARFSNSITSSATAQYSSAQRHLIRMDAAISWSPRPLSTVSLGFHYNYAPQVSDDQIKQIDLSFQWPITDRLYALARYNYSLNSKKPIEMIGGFEYLHDCYTVRVAAQRYTTAANVQETNFFLQLELSGLVSIGTNPISELRRNIRGYQTRETVIGAPNPYDYYE